MPYKKENDYTLSETTETQGGGSLTRTFNFASGTITTLFRESVVQKDSMRAYGSDGGVSMAIGVALTSQMHVQKFSELDSFHEVALLHKELEKAGGHPPPLEDLLATANMATGKDLKLGRALQLKPPGT